MILLYLFCSPTSSSSPSQSRSKSSWSYPTTLDLQPLSTLAPSDLWQKTSPSLKRIENSIFSQLISFFLLISFSQLNLFPQVIFRIFYFLPELIFRILYFLPHLTTHWKLKQGAARQARSSSCLKIIVIIFIIFIIFIILNVVIILILIIICGTFSGGQSP